MREIRPSGSEGGGALCSPYPYQYSVGDPRSPLQRDRQSAIVNELIPATTYSPTRFPLQYHGPWRA